MIESFVYECYNLSKQINKCEVDKFMTICALAKGGGMETNMLKRDYNWEAGYELAKVFGEQYSKDITVFEYPQEICIEGIDYQLVQLSFPAKGNKLLKEQLLQTGFCTSMDGRIENGKLITNLLLWIETNPIAYHRV